MGKIRKSTILILIITGLLLIGVIWLQAQNQERGIVAEAIPFFDTGEINKITLTQGNKALEMYLDAQSWKIKDQDHAADEVKIDRLLHALHEVKLGAIAAEAADREFSRPLQIFASLVVGRGRVEAQRRALGDLPVRRRAELRAVAVQRTGLDFDHAGERDGCRRHLAAARTRLDDLREGGRHRLRVGIVFPGRHVDRQHRPFRRHRRVRQGNTRQRHRTQQTDQISFQCHNSHPRQTMNIFRPDSIHDSRGKCTKLMEIPHFITSKSSVKRRRLPPCGTAQPESAPYRRTHGRGRTPCAPFLDGGRDRTPGDPSPAQPPTHAETARPESMPNPCFRTTCR